MHSRYDGYSFPLWNTVTREKVRFHNRYGIELAGDLYLPREVDGKLAAVAVSGPFGAVKEQCSGLYAEELAARGFAALAFDPSFTGESGGAVRNVASPDINTEDFSAAVDFLATRDFVDPEKGEPSSLDIYYCDAAGESITIPGLDVTIPMDTPYSGLAMA